MKLFTVGFSIFCDFCEFIIIWKFMSWHYYTVLNKKIETVMLSFVDLRNTL